MKVKLKQDQYYIGADGGRYFGAKGSTIDICPNFAKLIRDKYEVIKNQESEKENAKIDKPLEKMNRQELIAKIKELGIDVTDDEIEAMTKSELIKVIVNFK